MAEQVQTTNPSPSPSSSAPSPAPKAAAPAAASPSTNQSKAGTAPPQKTDRPEWLPEDYWDTKGNSIKGEDFRKKFDELSAYQAEQSIKQQSVPQSADEYALELPQDFENPLGGEITFDNESPFMAQAREAAHEMGLSQEGFSKLLAIYTAAQIHENQKFGKMRDEQVKALGANGPARVDAITTWLKSQGADEISVQWWTAKAIGQMEKLITKFTSQGAGRFSQSGRDHQAAPKVDDEAWGKMTYAEQRDYANKHKQNAA